MPLLVSTKVQHPQASQKRKLCSVFHVSDPPFNALAASTVADEPENDPIAAEALLKQPQLRQAV